MYFLIFVAFSEYLNFNALQSLATGFGKCCTYVINDIL
jgi:hypothetical protein